MLVAAHLAHGRHVAGNSAVDRGHAAWRFLACIFYAGNIAGAVFGCLMAGFYLLRVYDMTTATYIAATINGAVSLIALGLANHTPYRDPTKEAAAVPALSRPALSPVHLTIALSGLCASVPRSSGHAYCRSCWGRRSTPSPLSWPFF